VSSSTATTALNAKWVSHSEIFCSLHRPGRGLFRWHCDLRNYGPVLWHQRLPFLLRHLQGNLQ
jgi:hypothetical protein